MVFASYSFIFIFLPLRSWVTISRAGWEQTYAVGWLVLLSLVFYGVWNPVFVTGPLLYCIQLRGWPGAACTR